LVIPTTYGSALLLLVLALLLLGLWPSTFKRTGPQWRFELFYFDFAVGAILLAVIAAFTFGTFGSEMAFDDRMLVAGRSAQVWVVGAGFLFNLGNMMLLAAISLLGLSGAVPLAGGMALIVASVLNFRAGNVLFLISGIVLLLVALVLDGAACRVRDLGDATPAKGSGKPIPAAAPKSKTRRTSKGIAIALLSGIPLGLFYPLFAKGEAGDFGLGPYAGILLFCVGMVVATIICNFYFMNIAIEGGALAFNAYFRGRASQHFLGFAGGAMWAAGALAAALGSGAPARIGISASLRVLLPLASAVLALLTGFWLWKEFPEKSKNARVWIGVTAFVFACGLALVGSGLSG
jgi:glucose uptake protein